MIRLTCLAVWALVAALFVACELAALVAPERAAGFGRVLDVVATGRARTLPLFVAWMWLGWHFFAR